VTAVEELRDDDLAEAVALRNVVSPHDLLSVEAFAAMRATPRRVDLVVRDRKRMVGVAGCMPDRWSPASDAAFCGVSVLPDYRRRGIGTQLANAISAHARSLGKRGLLVGVWEDSADGVAFARRRGFEEVARLRVVALDLTEPGREPEVVAPPGVTIERMADDDAFRRELYEVAAEVEADVPSVSGVEPSIPPFEDWCRRSFKTALLEHSFVARAGGEIVAYAILGATADARVAFHEMTGVRRAWRGRGLAKALKLAQIASARAAGVRELSAMNEETNAPMRAINAALGYRPRPAKLSLRGPLLG